MIRNGAGTLTQTSRSSNEPEPGPVMPSWFLPRRQRRPLIIAMSVVLAVVGGIAAGWLVNSSGGRTQVLTVARDVQYGTVIDDADLQVANIASDSVLSPISADRRSEVVGQFAALELRPGMLLTSNLITSEVLPGPANEIVPIAVIAERMPALGLRPGGRILVVATPAQGADLPSARPRDVSATVVAVGAADPNGTRMVDLQVPAGEGPVLSSLVGTGRFGLVLEPAGR